MDRNPELEAAGARITRVLERITPAVRAMAQELVAQAGLPRDFPKRFMEIYTSFAGSWEAGVQFDAGWRAGVDSAEFLRIQNAPFDTVVTKLEAIRNRLFFGVIPQHVPERDRLRYFDGLAIFLTAYIRAMSVSGVVYDFREISEIARRLSAAESMDQLEMEAVAGADKLLTVDYSWFTHREGGVWHISHATQLSPEAALGRLKDQDVDGIDELLHGLPLVYEDLRNCAPSMRGLAKILRLGSALSVPVMQNGVCVGTLGVGRRVPSKFTEHDLAIVQLITSQASASANVRQAVSALQQSDAQLRMLLDEQRRELRRKEEIANALQQVFIPKAFPTTQRVVFDAVYLPAENDAQIGGDWYDAFALPSGELVFSIGDVAGHGLEAAVTMGKIRQNIFSAALDSSDPAAVLQKVNRVLLLQGATMATAIVGFIDPKTMRVTYCSAGHSPPILAAGEAPKLMRHGGLALGIQETLHLENETFHASPETMLVLYTDGITESQHDIFEGEERLLHAVEEVHRTPNIDMPAQMIQKMTLKNREHRDDVAILAIRFLHPSAAGGVSSIQSRPHGMAWDFDSADAEAARRARRQVVDFVRSHTSSDHEMYSVESIVGELIANTVEHAPGPVHIDIDWSDAHPTLRVQDNGKSFEGYESPAAPDPFSEDGRGLFLISTLGSQVRVETHAYTGKEISVVLPVRRAV